MPQPILLDITTPLGIFHEVNRFSGPMVDAWKFECPSCHAAQYMDIEQWLGSISVECICGNYRETHNYKETLLLGLKAVLR